MMVIVCDVPLSPSTPQQSGSLGKEEKQVKSLTLMENGLRLASWRCSSCKGPSGQAALVQWALKKLALPL